jgi:hypothetical protein
MEILRFDDDGDPIVRDANGELWLCWFSEIKFRWRRWRVSEDGEILVKATPMSRAEDVPPAWRNLLNLHKLGRA